MAYRIGIDLGGTKTEIAALDVEGRIVLRRRLGTAADYRTRLGQIGDLVHEAEAELGAKATVGVGIPGVISPATGLVKNANSTAINGQPFDRDLAELLDRPVRVENDANCFALSEAADGAAAGSRVVFGVILGTGCGAGIIVDGKVVEGRHRIAGEWGHNPLPWPSPEEMPGPQCWCGQRGCLETWIAGPALARSADGPEARDARSLPARAAQGEARAAEALARHVDRVARGLAHVVNILDPDAIVLGGGVSNMEHLYTDLPALVRRHVFSDFVNTPILRNKHGDSSGVRGAAWLWPKA